MSDRKFAKASQLLLRQIWKLPRAITKALVMWLLRLWLVVNRRRGLRTAGFVLPTTVMLLLVVTLTVGALVFRAYNRTTQVIGESQQRVIYNAATPAIDRARAKLETMFDPNQDNRYPGGVPGENYLAGMLRNDGSYSVGGLPGTPTNDIYTLPDETRVNLDNQTKTGETRGEDNAWAFRTDTNGDGTPDATVLYSIIFQAPADDLDSSGNPIAGSGVLSRTDSVKANNLWTRTAPLTNRQRGNCGVTTTQASSAAQGWFQDLTSTSILRKNFQVDALVIPDNARNRNNFTTLEMQHDRKLDRGNKWGAWFRYDMEIYPGPVFNWNGAMHTEGSLMAQPTDGFNAYLVSAQNSCLMSSPSNSEISITNITRSPSFIGAAIGSSMRDNGTPGNYPVNIHVFPVNNTNTGPSQNVPLNATTGSAQPTARPQDIGLDPVALITRDLSLARGGDPSNRTNVTATAGNPWTLPPGEPENARISNKAEPKPYVDDLYRADDRWGPKPLYSDQIRLNGSNQQPGRRITAATVTRAADLNALTGLVPSNPDDPSTVGLDGYWERRARFEGLRVIVGQRLELGNMFGWTNADSLYPPDQNISHQQRQRRTLRDNLAAVQATAIYHADNPGGKDFPTACLASTVHPGTAETLRESITFEARPITSSSDLRLITDFFTGRGTDGWEFAPPQGTESSFETAFNNTSSSLRKALENLAYFAGDYVSSTQNGAFPPTQDSRIHPYPLLSMWGNFSELRRTLAEGGTYANLSPADKTNLHTAACTLGMLAYNIDTFQEYTPPASDVAELEANIGSATTPEAALVALESSSLTGARKQALKGVALAIFNRHQIARDRQFGFGNGGVAGQCPVTGALQTAFCQATPRYPALFYLFPVANHGHNTGQPAGEPYIADTYIASTVNSGGARYQVVGTGIAGNATEFDAIRLAPRATDFSNWLLPNAAPSNITNANVSPNRIQVSVNGATPTTRAVGFLDRAIFNGREMMTTRLMDVDLGMLRSRESAATANKPWLPISGIVYAFREDAVREDGIMRPSSGNPNSQTDTRTETSPRDPQLVTTPQNIAISTKQVDYIGDPDRRPHGFRLRNGKQLKRNASFGIPATDNVRGLSFISDNPVTIQGDFNWHQDGGDDTAGSRIEEFTQLLGSSGPGGTYTEAEFYGRTTRDPDFANPSEDRWRPSEILTDAVSILSDSFCDGSIEDAFVTASATNQPTDTISRDKYNRNGLFDPGCGGDGPTSFMNQNRPQPPSNVAWVREDASETTSPPPNSAVPAGITSPIKIDRNGNPVTTPASTSLTYDAFTDDKPLMEASPTRVYSIIVSGIVPARPNQGYGGLHNFPRFLESWSNKNLWFNGSFLQLNFSNYATGPFEQDAWEPGDTPNTTQPIQYYKNAPNRLWGYDTALQLAPASPAAARFVTANRVRNEFYTELPVSDPYINNLCKAFNRSPKTGSLSGAPNDPVTCPGG
jgi:hypothetical protein